MANADNLLRRDGMKRRTVTIQDVTSGALDDLTDSNELAKLVLKWTPDGHKKRETDIGAYCYAVRSSANYYARVDPESLITHELLANIILGTLRQLADKPDPTSTVALGYITNILHIDQRRELVNANSILLRLNRQLRTLDETGTKRRGSLINTERAAIKILQLGFDESSDDVTHGVRLLRNWKLSPNEKPGLSSKAGAAISRAAHDHFLQVSKILLEDKPLPTKIDINGKGYLVTASRAFHHGLPRYLELDENGHPPPDSIYGPDLQLRKLPCPRYGCGRPDAVIRRILNKYHLGHNEHCRILDANGSRHSNVRKRLASEALLSFCVYTYFDTGANVASLQGRVRIGKQQDAILVSQIIDNDQSIVLDTERGTKGYVVTIRKPRAKNKSIDILFSSIWVKRFFPVYLELRNHLSELGTNVPDNLIFCLQDPTRGGYRVTPNPRVFTRLQVNKGHPINQVMREHGVERIDAQMVRDFKLRSLSREHGPVTGAKLLGHSLETSQKHYHRIAEAESQLQISKCLNTIMSVAIVESEKDVRERLASGGACRKPDSLPDVEVESEELGIHSPNCRTKTGCWTCPHFAVHADKEDLYKMRSYLYVIDELQANSIDPVGLAIVHKPIVERLTNLCSRIIEANPSLAEIDMAIKRMIAKSEIHPVYQSLLQTYEKVNLI